MKFTFSDAAFMAAGAGLGAVIAQQIGKFYVRYPMVSKIYGAYLAPLIIGFFLIASRAGFFSDMGIGMFAYGAGKLIYNGLIRLME